MDKSSFYLLFLVLTCLTNDAAGESKPTKVCPYPESPINWVMKYCAYIAETDDEIAIQESQCFKAAAGDLGNKDECAVKKKYKTMACEQIKKLGGKHRSIADCVADTKVAPFLAGS